MPRPTLILLLACAFFPASLLGQSTGALSGTVEDPSGALIPGTEITATNQDTGVATLQLSNSSGSYNFPALQPGIYVVRAVFPSFQTRTFTDVNVRASTTNRLNFVLELANQVTEVEVTISADQLLLESSPSVGDVLETQEVVNLPTVTNNVLDLISVMAGVTVNDGGLGLTGDFAGVSAQGINITRDGISVSEQRFNDTTGINAATVINPDMVGEMKLILSPVDAETGRGNGQIQIITRSGGNEYHGGAVWNIRNSALDARTWEDNSEVGGPPTQPWTNQNQYTITFGGPIVRNQTFFFVLWDQNISKSRENRVAQVLSPCMQRGIFRYWEGYDNGAADAIPSDDNPTNPLRPAVDFNGNPLAPESGMQLQHVSLFGDVLNAPGTMANDCANAQIGPAPTDTGSWDPFRTTFETTGYFDLLNSRAPEANTWAENESGALLDGLNVVGHRWTRTIDGRDNVFGVGEPNPRKQINVKVDHIFSQAHKLSTSYTFEKDNADDEPGGWPEGSFSARVLRQPQVFSSNLTSTLASNIVNEFRFGMTRQGSNSVHALETPGNEDLRDLLPHVDGLPILTQWCTPAGLFQPVTMSWCGENGGLTGGRGHGPSVVSLVDTSPRWTFADTMSWTIGRHSFRFGGTYLRSTSRSQTGGNFQQSARPTVFLGSASNAPNNAFSQNVAGGWRDLNPGLADGLVTNNDNRMEELLLFLSGSLDRVEQYRFINDPGQVGAEWNDFASGETDVIRDFQQREFNAFFKDDWKLTDNLTLNLGMRWDYFGVPYDKNGMTLSIVGGGTSLFGRSGNSFEGWFNPGERGSDVEFTFVGPDSPNPDQSIYESDLNNFGPAVGFSYNVPWLGRDRTVLRGGYQVTYQGGGSAAQIGAIFQNPPGSATLAAFEGANGGDYFDLADVVNSGIGFPAEPSFLPVLPVPVTDRGVNLTVFDPNYRSPYIQNLTASLTHTFNSVFSVDVKYVGTLSRKLAENFNINEPNIYQNGLYQAFESARRGGESPLLDAIFEGINMKTSGFQSDRIVGQNGLTGAELLRIDTRWQTNLANGAYLPIAENFNDLNYSTAFNPDLPDIETGEAGAVLRHANQRTGGMFPENFIYTSPQFENANIRSNLGHRNYHSMQAQMTMRPRYGLQTTITYTWAKNLGRSGNYTIPWDRAIDYRASGRAHTLNAYGTFNLPVGPNQLLLGDSSGVLARVVEGWQMSWIYRASTGSVLNINASPSLYGGVNDPILAEGASFPLDGHELDWEDGAEFGRYFGDGFVRDLDPQCLNPNVVWTAGLEGSDNLCTRNALYDTSGNLILRTPLPGEIGTFRDRLQGLGTWSLDMALSKRFQIDERFGFELRVDATNILNHPTPDGPSVSLQGSNNGAGFGGITSKEGSRIFQVRMRLDF